MQGVRELSTESLKLRFTRKQTHALSWLFSPHLVTAACQYGLGALAPLINADLNLSRAAFGLLSTARFLGHSLVSFSVGQVVDRSGVRKMLLIGMLAFGASFAFLGAAPSLTWALVVCLLSGVGFAIINPSTTKGIIDWFAQRGRATAMGIKQTGVPTGSLLAGLLFPSLARIIGWRWTVTLAGLATVVAAGLVWMFYRDPPDAVRAQPSNGRGAWGWFRDSWELLNWNMLVTSLVQGVFLSAQHVFVSYYVLYLTEYQGFTVVLAGLMLSLVNAVGMVSRLGWGLAGDVIFAGKHTRTIVALGILTIVGSLILGLTPRQSPHFLPILGGVILGSGALGWQGILHLLRADLTDKDKVGAATGVGFFVASWGGVVAPPLFGWVVDRLNGAYQMAWLLLAVVMVSSLILLRFLRPNEVAPSKELASGATPQ